MKIKIIFSRKGIDSSYGGYRSPILPDGTLISIPIPEESEVTNQLFNDEPYNKLKYDDLFLPINIQNFFAENNFRIETYFDLMIQLTKHNPFLRRHDKYGKINLQEKNKRFCHLDPDLRNEVINHDEKWRPLFGQSGGAETYLINNQVEEGDLFLFYGRFKEIEIKNNELIWKYKSNEIHIIFGYLQVGSIIRDDSQEYHQNNIENWMLYHPHFENYHWFHEQPNTIYVARENLSWNENISGAGMFSYYENLVLTETNPNLNPKLNLSYWNSQIIAPDTKISKHNKKNWINDENGRYFKTKSPGQEYITEDKHIVKWISNLINQIFN